MSDATAAMIWSALGAYAAPGVILWLWLLAGGFKRLDPLAAAAPLRVKALLAPGLIALWPLVLRRAWGVSAPEDRL